MEKKTFRFVKNILFPFKSTVEIGPDGVTNKGKFTAWKDITACTYSITSVNGAMNYIIFYTDNHGKRHQLNYIVALTGSKSKKEMCAEIYQMFHEGFTTHLILPTVYKALHQLEQGMEVQLAGTTVTKKGITVPKGFIIKGPVFIPMEHILIEHRKGAGGFDVLSSANRKDHGFFPFESPEARELLALLEHLHPEQAMIYTTHEPNSDLALRRISLLRDLGLTT